MFQRSGRSLRVSAFSVFQRELSRQGKLTGKANPQKYASWLYKRLTTVEKNALKKRASHISYPALDAYNQFQKVYAHRFRNLPNKSRQQKVAALWEKLKVKGTIVPCKPIKKCASARPLVDARRTIKTASSRVSEKAAKTKAKSADTGVSQPKISASSKV